MRLLLIEDDTLLGAAVRDHCKAHNHAVDWLQTIADAESALRAVSYDFILLDLRLPDGNGVALLKSLRARNIFTPVIILTAHDQISDRIEGLSAGADDYLVKPFDLHELTARILAVNRRFSGRSHSEVKLDNMTIDPQNRRVLIDGRDVDLSGREWAILEYFCEHPKMVIARTKLEEMLYAFGSEIESNTVEVYISRLRKKIGQNRIKTHRGLGYSLC